MDNSEDNTNPFLPLGKTSKYQESKIFGESSLQFQGGNSSTSTSKAAKTPVTQSLFGNPSVFGNLPASSTFSQVSKDSGKSQNLFSKTFHDVATSSSAQVGTIFGSVPAMTPSNPLKPLKQNESKANNNNNSGNLISKSGNEPFKSKLFGSDQQPGNSESSQTPHSQSLFSLKSRENKDSKDPVFGGNIDKSQTQFKSFDGIKDSKFKLGEFSSFNKATKSSDTSFSVFGKPEKVFANVKTKKDSSPKTFSFESLIKPSSTDKQVNIFQKSSPAEIDDLTKYKKVDHDSHNKVVPPSVLIACNIPSKYVNSSVLKNHFSKFGDVQKVNVNSKTNQAAIYFSDHKSAQEAKAKGKRLHPLLEEMKLFFGSQSQVIKPTEKTSTIKPLKESSKMSARSSPYNKKLDSLVKSSKNGKANERNKSPNLSGKPETKNKAPSGNLVSLKDFSVIVKTQAKNNYDKFLILDARDKNIRAKQEKIVDVKKARYLSASCPDMCPEKERYSRDIQYDISEYEMTNNEMDHKLTVKKFSRSSADKDEPLPHELRPGPVLKMTMDFLLCNIVQKGDDPSVQIDLWYNYLCNRTRGLRSDIMQQHLVDENAVYVLERCIRFHIHCSHALCEESPEYFDAKINSEHLSKSLQSLKELYHDLEDKGYSFENEAEFRGYEILLSINDGNVIFKYLKFKESVRNSSEVQFAVKVLQSIHTGNYVKFFKLLGRATYLQSCIMHKYFPNIRQRALNVIIKAFSTHPPPTINSIKTMLGFSDEEELLKYVGHFGIDMNELTSLQNISKTFLNPSVLPPVFKSLHIIMKKNNSVTEVINNGPIPDNPLTYYKTHSSFNSAGYLRKKAIDASDQVYVPEVSNVSKFKVSVCDPPDVTQKKQIEIDENTKEINLKAQLNARLKETYESMVLRRYFKRWKIYTSYQKKFKYLEEKLIMLKVKNMFLIWKNKAHQLAVSKRNAEKLLVRRCFKMWREYIRLLYETKESISISKNIESKIVSRKFFNIWRRNIYIVKSKREEQRVRDHLLKFRFFHKWLNITKESLANEKSDKFYNFKLLKSSFLQWKSWLVARKNRNKVNIELFPAVGSLLSAESQNHLFDWGYNRDNKSYISTEEILNLGDEIYIKNLKHFSVEKLTSIMSWMPLPLIQKFQNDILTNTPDLSGNLFHTCFKILLLIDYTSIDQYLLHWVRTKFNFLEFEDLSHPLHCESRFKSPKNEMEYSLLLSEKKLLYELKELDSCSLVILVGNENKFDCLEKISEKFGHVPFLILCGSDLKSDLCHNTWLLTKETIDNPYTSEKLFNFIVTQWSIMKDRFRFDISSCLKIVTSFIFHKVVSSINYELNQRQLYGKPNLHPTTIVSFYNAAILHVQLCFEKSKSLICDKQLFEKFSQNFLCSSMRNDREFEAVITSLKNACLPQFNVSFDNPCSEIESDIVKYIAEMSSSSDWKGSLYSEVKLIIKETRKKFFEDKFYCNALKLDKFWYYIPWVEIFNSFIIFKTSLLPDVNVAYRISDLSEFDSSNYWASEIKLSKLVVPETQERETSIKRKATVSLPKKDAKKIKAESLLLQDIENEKRKTLEYEKKLQALLSIGEDNTMPNFEV